MGRFCRQSPNHLVRDTWLAAWTEQRLPLRPTRSAELSALTMASPGPQEKNTSHS